MLLSPFVGGKTARQISAQQGRDGQIPMRLGKIGAEADGCLAGLDRLGGAALLGQDVTEAGMGLGQGRVQPERGAVQRFRRGQVIKVGRRVAHVQP